MNSILVERLEMKILADFIPITDISNKMLFFKPSYDVEANLNHVGTNVKTKNIFQRILKVISNKV